MGRQAAMARTEDEPTDAQAWQLVALRALRDVEYDYHTGKLDGPDYEALKAELTAEAVQALRRAKEGEGMGPGATVTEQDVQTEVLRLRDAVRRGIPCVACAHLNPPASRFCASCGALLAEPSTATSGERDTA